jgi:hypothetical protein
MTTEFTFYKTPQKQKEEKLMQTLRNKMSDTTRIVHVKMVLIVKWATCVFTSFGESRPLGAVVRALGAKI